MIVLGAVHFRGNDVDPGSFTRFVSSRQQKARAAVIVAALVVQACSTPTRLGPEPASVTVGAVAIDTPNARFFPDEQVTELFEEALRASEREMREHNVTIQSQLPPAHFLAVSGGSDDGAFGAGLLIGWTETGTRPEFKVVTGVSTGALIAPFAFLGPAYDAKLREVFTQTSAESIFVRRGPLAALFDDALSDTSPLFRLISMHVNDAMLAEIAREYHKGRLLFIGTTYLDGRRGVIWNIGAIAASGHPKAAELIRKILLASSAVPAAFPPVMIDVVAGGKRFQEMHVDGGVMAQLFLYPPGVGSLMTGTGIKRERHAYIVRNGRLGVPWSEVHRTTLNIANRAISTMIHVSGLNDLFRVYMITQRDGVGYNLAFIEDDFEAPDRHEDFDPVYMNKLFDYGYAKGRAGYDWKKFPPFMETPTRQPAQRR